MSEEEKKAIEYIKNKIEDNRNKIIEIEHKNDSSLVGYGTMHDIYKLQNCNYLILLNLIEKQINRIDQLEKEKHIHIKLEHQYKKEYLDAKERMKQLETKYEELEQKYIIRSEAYNRNLLINANLQDEIEELKADSIPKSLIRKKINCRIMELGNMTTHFYTDSNNRTVAVNYDRQEELIKLKQELLGEKMREDTGCYVGTDKYRKHKLVGGISNGKRNKN